MVNERYNIDSVTFFEDFKERLANHYVVSQYSSNPFRASSAGTCARQLGYKKLYPNEGMDTEQTVDIQFQSLLDLGNTIHDSERELYAKLGYTLEKVEESVTATYTMDDMSSIDIRGKVDGVISYEDANKNIKYKAVFDIKTAGNGPFNKVKSMGLPYAYKAQASVYAKALNVPNVLFIYYNKDTSERMVLEYIDDPLMQESVRRRFNKVYETKDEDTLPDRELKPYRKREKGKLTDTLVLDPGCGRCLFKAKCYPEFELNDAGTHFVALLDDFDGEYITKAVKTRTKKED